MTPQMAQMLSAILQLKGMRMQQQQFDRSQALAERKFASDEDDRNLKASQSFISFLQKLPPEARGAWIAQAAQMGKTDPMHAKTISDALPEDVGLIANKLIAQNQGRVNGAQVASKALTGMSTGEAARDDYRTQFIQSHGDGNQELWNQYVNRDMTGQSSGQNNLDTGFQQLKPEDTLNAAKFQLSLGISPMQVVQNALAARGLNIQASQVPIAQQNANTAEFGANTQRELGRMELEARKAGDYNSSQANGTQNGMQAGRMILDAMGQLGQPSTPQANQEVLKRLIQQYAPMAGVGNNQFLNYLNSSQSPSWWDGFSRR